MSFAHESIAALPVIGNADKALIRALLTRRLAYALAPDESAEDFVAIDPASGVLPLCLIQSNVLFQLDASDTTTAHDGVTCLVTSDDKRYKSDTIAYPWSVLARATAQPTSPAPSIGDRYLLNTAATGTDWAGHDDEVAIYTARGWVSATVPLGRFLYVEGETAFYHRNADGEWTAGVGSVAIGSNSVPLSALIGSGLRSIVKVENQTTNTPPASPTKPTAYIIGSSPTGVWSGKPGQVAVCEVDGAWTYYVPDTGDRVYDKSLSLDAEWLGTAWVSAAGAWVGFNSVTTPGTGSITTSLLVGGTTVYATYSASSGPTTSNRRTRDDATLTYEARRSGSKLRFRYECVVLGWSNNASNIGNAVSADAPQVVALYRDTESNAIDWCLIGRALGSGVWDDPCHIVVEFLVNAVDADSHTYTIGILGGVLNNGLTDLMREPGSLSRRHFTVEESF